MATAIYPGTFDPITYGHIDIARRAAGIFRHVYAVVADNPAKNPFFTLDERHRMAREALSGIKRIEVITYSGLIADCVREMRASAIIRGLRAISDFEYEFQMAFTNRNMNRNAETVFLMPNEKYTYLNSSMVKQIAHLGGDISSFVPASVEQLFRRKIRDRKGR